MQRTIAVKTVKKIQMGPKAGEVRVQLYISLHCAVVEKSTKCCLTVHKDPHSE